MLHLSAGLPCLHGRLSSNVRPQKAAVLAGRPSRFFTVGKASCWRCIGRQALQGQGLCAIQESAGAAKPGEQAQEARLLVALGRKNGHDGPGFWIVSSSNPPPMEGCRPVQRPPGRRERSRLGLVVTSAVFAERGGVLLPPSSRIIAEAHRCGLTLRSSRPAPARHPGRPMRNIMLHWSARAPCLRGRLSSNVRPQENPPASTLVPEVQPLEVHHG
jgi:hypothetical protein